MKTYLIDFCDTKESTPLKNIPIKGTVSRVWVGPCIVLMD